MHYVLPENEFRFLIHFPRFSLRWGLKKIKIDFSLIILNSIVKEIVFFFILFFRNKLLSTKTCQISLTSIKILFLLNFPFLLFSRISQWRINNCTKRWLVTYNSVILFITKIYNCKCFSRYSQFRKFFGRTNSYPGGIVMSWKVPFTSYKQKTWRYCCLSCTSLFV